MLKMSLKSILFKIKNCFPILCMYIVNIIITIRI